MSLSVYIFIKVQFVVSNLQFVIAREESVCAA